MGVLIHIVPHDVQRCRKPGREDIIADSYALQGGLEDAQVGFTVIGNAVNSCIGAVDVAHGAIQGTIVNQVLGVQQRAVNIKQVSVGVEARRCVVL
ncbi:MAG: hypothetical protein DMG71_04735 [Acidobacteria bacterium]|nr:MAG: hypothetical protein DMG71_04735 [Acidobacteriota bacterium]